MRIELRHKIDNECILPFNCDNNDVKITNDDFKYIIEFKINKEEYDLLKSLNYSIAWNSDLIVTGGDVSDKDLHQMSLSTRKYYLNIPLTYLTDEQIYEFYGKMLGYTGVDLEYKIIKCKDEYYKTNLLCIYIDDMLLDIDKSIFSEKLTYIK